MLILGFNATHDAAAALVAEGRIVAALEEERLSRRKHHEGFPARALRAVLRLGGATWADVDRVAFYWDPRRGVGRFLLHVLRHWPRSRHYVREHPGIFRRFLGLPGLLRRRYDFRGRFHFVAHHEAHAASAFYPSPFERAAILSVDGTGEWTTTYLGVGEGQRIRRVATLGYPHSLGKLYEAITQYLGFRIGEGEGKVMGLAAHGRPRFRAFFEALVPPRPDGFFRLDLRYFQFHVGHPIKYGPRLVEVLGPPRAPEEPLSERHADVAASLQLVVEERLLALARALHARTGAEALCLAGGVALNCVANGRLLREGPFKAVFIQPAAHDGGAGLGAALLTAARLGEAVRQPMAHAYLGGETEPAACRAALRQAGLAWSEPPDLVGAVVDRLVRGRVVGWVQGRSEFGPRALGHRSLLADPRAAEAKERVNRQVKQREPFRPFAPAVPREEAARFFVDAVESPFMLLAFPVRPERRGDLPAVTHVDGTARVQTVRPDVEPLFHALLRAFGRRTGVPVLLNTSLNRRGEPMVETAADAVRLFQATDLDVLVLGPCLVERPRGGEK